MLSWGQALVMMAQTKKKTCKRSCSVLEWYDTHRA